jgi:DNA uptake protein ComE-like DNA-binding protein
VSLATAGFDDLRKIGMSVTQAKRVLRYRDERGLSTVAELEDVPGFPRSFLDELDDRLTD